jgi:outer membrane protein assembly factor BamA
MFAEYDLTATLLDYRKYFFFKPLSFAFRGLHYARYGKDRDRLYPLYAGDRYFVRGYSYNALDNNDSEQDILTVSNLLGTKMSIFNAEIRLPFSGPRQLTMIKSKYFYSTLVGFFDAGFALNEWNQFEFSLKAKEDTRTPVLSAGLALRINLFGYAILEPYVAIPFQLEQKPYSFGLFIRGVGW